MIGVGGTVQLQRPPLGLYLGRASLCYSQGPGIIHLVVKVVQPLQSVKNYHDSRVYGYGRLGLRVHRLVFGFRLQNVGCD